MRASTHAGAAVSRRGFLLTGLGGVVASARQVSTPVSPGSDTTARLAALARTFQSFVESHLLDADGLVRAYVSPRTLRPFTRDEILPRYIERVRDTCQNSADPAGALTYENSLMATGEFGMSQILRYWQTGSPDALALAHRVVRGVLAVAREGRYYMPGYLPKPHGGLAAARYSHEMSTDQYTKAIAVLYHWLPLAAAEERKEIVSFVADAADFFIARRFRFPWRQKLIVEPHVHLHTLALYVPLLQLAGTLINPTYFDQIAQFDGPLEAAVQRSRGAHRTHRYNEISLYLDGFDVALRSGNSDPRLTEIMRNLFDRGAESIDANGVGLEERQESSWVVRFVAGATLVRDSEGAAERGRLAGRVLERYDRIDRMRVRGYGDAVDGVDGVGIASWLLTYWRSRQ